MTARQPDRTRRNILDAAHWEIYRNGFQGASIDRILDGTGLTKGALYHHFSNKLQLGYAVVDEVIVERILERWVTPLAEHEDPVDGLKEAFRRVLGTMPEEEVHGGCPLNNLVQEMAGLDEGFRLRLETVLKEWERGVADRLRQGQEAGTVRGDLEATAVSSYLVAVLEGMAGASKATKGQGGFRQAADVYLAVVETLRSVSQSDEGA